MLLNEQQQSVRQWLQKRTNVDKQSIIADTIDSINKLIEEMEDVDIKDNAKAEAYHEHLNIASLHLTYASNRLEELTNEYGE